jgi:hypothetical protein
MKARCMKCRKDVEVKNPTIVSMKSKRNPNARAVTGVCTTCGTKVFKMVGKDFKM